MKIYYAVVTAEGSPRINLKKGCLVTFTSANTRVVDGKNVVDRVFANSNQIVPGSNYSYSMIGEVVDDTPTLLVQDVIEC